MNCLNPVKLKTGAVPCGKCLACLHKRRVSWFTRLKQELRNSTGAKFVTLTYDDEHLPIKAGTPVVSKDDVQKFMKRLRINLARQHDAKIRFFLVSEYGPTTLRPHYHGIFFDIPDKIDLQLIFVKSWQKGFVKVDPVEDACMMYVAKYCCTVADLPAKLLKKDTKPFMLCSRNPAIGSSYLTEVVKFHHRQSIRNYTVSQGGVKYALPRYYRDKLFDDDMKEQLREQVAEKQLLTFQEYMKKYGSYDIKNMLTPMNVQQQDDYKRKMLMRLKKQAKL